MGNGWFDTAVALLGIVGPGVGAVLGFLFKSVREDAKKAKADVEEFSRDLAAYKLHVAERYVTQDKLTEAVQNLERSIDRLIDAVKQASQETRDGFTHLHQRIDEKADKRLA